MNFEWSSNDIASMIITIYPNNITLNKTASRYFEHVNYVLLGLDKEKRLLGIKPIFKEDLEKNIYPRHCLHKISIGSSYARISNKSFINDLTLFADWDFDKNPHYKVNVYYDVKHSIMIGEI